MRQYLEEIETPFQMTTMAHGSSNSHVTDDVT